MLYIKNQDSVSDIQLNQLKINSKSKDQEKERKQCTSLHWLSRNLSKIVFRVNFKLTEGKNLPVASDSLEVTVVSSERDVESDDSLAGSDEFQVLRVNASGDGGVVVEELDLLEETRFGVLIELGAKLGAGSEMTKACNEQSR